MKHNHLSLILTSFLLSTSAMAMQGELSDAMNGIGRHDKGTVARRLHERADRRVQVLKQVRTFYGDFCLNEGAEVFLERARAALVPLTNAANKASYQDEFFNSYDTNCKPPALSDLSKGLAGQPPRSGNHVRIIRQIQTLTNEIEDLSRLHQARPAKKKELKTAKKGCLKLNEMLQVEGAEIKSKINNLNPLSENIKNAIARYSRSMEETQSEIEIIDHRIEMINSKINAPYLGQEVQTSKLEQLKAEKEELEKALTPVLREDEESSEEEEVSETSEKAHESSEAQESAPEPLPNESPHSEDLVLDPQAEEKKHKLLSVLKEIDDIESDLATKIAESNRIKKEFEHGLKTLDHQKKEKNEKFLQFQQKHTETADQLRIEVTAPLEQLTNELEEIEKKIRETKENREKVETQLQPFDDETAALLAQLSQKRVQKQKLQDEADLYALIKYVKYLNLYFALPNDDIAEDDYEGCKLSTLSHEDIPLIQQLTDSRVSEVASASVKEAVDRETGVAIESSYSRALVECESSLNCEAAIDRMVNYKAKGMMGFYSYSDVSIALSTAIRDKIDQVRMRERYEKASPLKVRYAFVDPSLPQLEYIKTMVNRSTPFRADTLLKAASLKWKARLSSEKDSLVQRMGLNSAFISNTFKIETNRPLLHLATLKELIGHDVFKAGDAKADWKLARNQLHINYDFTDRDSPVHTRITPITKFVEAKVIKERKRGGDFVQKFAAAESKEALVQKAFLKMLSYMTMHYALTHDEQGQPTPELKIMSPDIEPYVKADPIPPSKRVDNVMALKALKWADRLWQHGQDFIKEHGLKAWIFDDYKGSKALDNKGKEEL